MFVFVLFCFLFLTVKGFCEAVVFLHRYVLFLSVAVDFQAFFCHIGNKQLNSIEMNSTKFQLISLLISLTTEHFVKKF